MRKIGADPDQPQSGEGIGGVLHSAQHRQSHFRVGRMAELMKQHEQRISGDELYEPLKIFQGEVFILWIIMEARAAASILS